MSARAIVVVMARRLIVNADDFGISDKVSRGILQAFERGVVTSTTVMTNSPGARDAVDLARFTAPTLDLGVHLNLTHGRPMCDPGEVPSLVGAEGRFWPGMQMWDRLPHARSSEVRAELRAQIEALIAWGVRPSHLDSHHFVTYRFPQCLEVMFDLASEYELPIRWFSPQQSDDIATRFHLSKEDAPKFLEAGARRLDSARLWHPDHLVFHFIADRVSVAELGAIIESMPEGVTELMCHPGFHDPELDDIYRAERAVELEVLVEHQIRATLDRHGVELTSFSRESRPKAVS